MRDLPGATYDQAAVMLIRERLAQERTMTLCVQSASMLPLIRPGDTITLVCCCAGQVHAGEIIVYERPPFFFVHRVLFRRAQGFITKGDNARRCDAPVTQGALLGKIVCVSRATRSILIGSAGWRFLGRLIAFISYLESVVYACLRGKRTSLPVLCAESSA